ncbi:hypothetical protein ACWKWU_22450 [Chitinophaga lutea]
MKKYSVFLLLLAQQGLAQSSSRTSEWVSPGNGRTLVYKTLPKGDRIPDFSYAGYGGGGISIPSPAATITIGPVEGDNSAQIQAAIDKVAAMPLQNGFRGVVALKAGEYPVSQPIVIRHSGIVLRGSGAGENGTVLRLTDKPHTAVMIAGTVRTTRIGEPTDMADEYVPAGATTFRVLHPGGFKAGDTISINRPVTEAWIRFMGMDHLTRDGKAQTWLTGDIPVMRTIRAVQGDRITVDLPLTDNYDPAYLRPPGVSVVRIRTEGEITQCGIEQLHIAAPEQSVTISQGHHKAFTMRGVADAWARNITVVNTVNSVTISDSRRVTVDNVEILHTVPTIGAAKPADFSGNAAQLLFNRCRVQGDNLFYFATGAKVSGPIVLLNCVFRGEGWIQPHQRWATAVLTDGCNVPNGGIDFMNRGIMGSGHGWSIGWAVAWNCNAKTYLNQQPPGAANWVIGSTGEKTRRAIPFDTIPYLPEGIYDAHGAPVTPASLYLAQLSERLGPQAVRNIGY